MIDKLRELIEVSRGAVFGWRKLGVLIGMLVAMFAWLFMFTVKTSEGAIAPDLPPVFAGTALALYMTFVVGNWKVHKMKEE